MTGPRCRSLSSTIPATEASLRRSRLARSDEPGDVARVPPHAANVLRRERVQEVEADEVEPRLGRDPSFVHRLHVVTEDRDLDPPEVLSEAGAPDDVCDIQDPSVLEYGQAVMGVDRFCDALDAGSEEVLRLHPDARRAALEDMRAGLAA